MMSHFVECDDASAQQSCAKSSRAAILDNIQSVTPGAPLLQRKQGSREFEAEAGAFVKKSVLYGRLCGAAVEYLPDSARKAESRKDTELPTSASGLSAFKTGIKDALQGSALELAMSRILARPFPANDIIMVVGEHKCSVLAYNGVADPDLCVASAKGFKIQQKAQHCALLALQRSTCCLEACDCKLQSAHLFGGFEVVELQGNKLFAVTFGNCENLRRLVLSDNALSSLDCSALPLLEELRAEHNKIGEVALAGKQIQRIFLKDNSLWRFSIAALPRLVTLDLSCNKLQALSLSDAPELSTVFLAENLLTTLRTERCPNLRFLDAHANQLQAFSAGACLSLQFLDLSCNRLGSADLEQLASLKRLLLNDNLLESVQLPGAADFEVVNLLNNRLRQVCVDRSRCKKLVFDAGVRNAVSW